LAAKRWAIALLVLTFAGGSGHAAAGAGASHTVTIDGTAFKPPAITVKAGDSVVWVNNDPFPHTATATAGSFDSKPIAAGQSWRFTPRAKGDFAYKCTLHPTMRGTLHVQ
jgi:plastocyanin